MSTYYYFKCEKCQEFGGMYTHQAWGWGNFYVVETFKFLALHTDRCGPEFIKVAAEHDVPEESEETIFEPHYRKKFLEDTKDYFPGFETGFSDGTPFSSFNFNQLREEWYNREMKANTDRLDYYEKNKDELDE